ncbi:hypothetical protein [Fibrobacter sp.]|uniref:hypothetical protein n=1 Tax=Fibrobacter sp. TaxID=35828 RepID=UPI00388F06F4
MKIFVWNANRKLQMTRSLSFFDEIQACPKAITSLKYFCEGLRPEISPSFSALSQSFI